MKPRDTNKLGVVKVRLSSVEEKIEVLRSKRKCDDNADAENIIIKTCESHDSRVNRLNNKFLLSKLPDGKEYTITGHGLIKPKLDSTVKPGEGGVGSDDAEKIDDENPETVPGEMGDNGVPRGNSATQQPDHPRPSNGNNENGRRNGANQSAAGRTQHPNSAESSAPKGKRGGRGGGPATTRRSSRNQGTLRA